MSEKKIIFAIGVDHRGYKLKEYLKQYKNIDSFSILWLDLGTHNIERTDYPYFAKAVVKAIKNGDADYGILSCGSGIGMAITANRYPGIYAGLVWDEDIAKSAKEDDNVNTLVLPADYITFDQAYNILKSWFLAKFKSDRYAERLKMIDQ
jgi:ribose 5-phosphate isomerase B